MQHFLRPIVSILCFSISLASSARSVSTTDSLLAVYDQEIQRSQTYLDKRQSVIDSLCQLPESAERNLAIGEMYRPYLCDSAILYYSKVLSAESPYSIEAQIRLVYSLSSIGFYGEAFQMSEEISSVPEHLKSDYYKAMNRMYGESSVYGKLQHYKTANNILANVYKDSLIQTLQNKPEKSVQLYQFELTQARDWKHNYEEALEKSDSALSLLTEDSLMYAMLAYETAIIYRDMGDNDLFMQWLVKSAIADVRCGITDNGSSWMLAQLEYDKGDFVRAYNYIEYSLTNAGLYNARLRYMQINPLGLIISKSYQAKQHTLSQGLLYAVGALLIVLAVLLLVIAYTIHQNRRLHALYEKQGLMNAELNTLNAKLKALNNDLSGLNLNLQEVNLVKEQYICRYLEVYSEYVQRLTKMARKAGIKDPDGFRNKEMDEYYRSFDNTFLSLYRSFVSDFNALLRPEERIVPKQGELLTTELRIFALIRLGIDSSAKIAELLCYSPNTIYNYRARVKNCALGNREDFEEKVRHIGSIQLPISK